MRATALRPHRCPACGRVIVRLDPRWSWNRVVAVVRSALESHTPMCVSDVDSSDENSATTDISCSDDSCIVVGRVGDRLAAWRLDGTAVARIDLLPAGVVDRFVAAPRVSVRDSSVVIAGTGRNEVLTTVGERWTSTPRPAARCGRSLSPTTGSTCSFDQQTA